MMQEISSFEIKDDEKRYKKPIEKKKVQSGKSFPFTSNNEFNGIINYLREKSNGNITNEIDFTASSSYNEISDNFGHVSNIAIFDNDEKGFFTKSIPNSWICLDFKDHKIIPTDYTINTCSGGPYPMSWVIEASNDNNSSWDPIDEQRDYPDFNGPNLSHSFKIGKENLKEYRFIRIRQIKTYNNSNHLGIGSFEIYGTLI